MLSGMWPMAIQQGVNICPPGYILALDQQGSSSGLASCVFCKAGTYSIHPLAYAPGSAVVAACVNCPAGGDCTNGGAEVQFKIGVWTDCEGIYILIQCPAGHQLINSTAGTSSGIFSSNLQQCRPCLPGQYIINPNSDDCQDCPPGIYSCRMPSSVT